MLSHLTRRSTRTINNITMKLTSYIYCKMSALLLSISTFSTALSPISTTTGRPNTEDYKSLLLNDVSLMDVRAPVEFSKGAFPASFNVPLMTDDERHQVGICYADNGREAAMELGHKLVPPEIRKERMKEWAAFALENPTTSYLYCFRGGLRSNIVQEWIEEETGIRVPLVIGGYKAMRTYCMESLESSLSEINLIRICGPTGSGKTKVLDQLPTQGLDLEGLAHHRGSAFGGFPDHKQPSQIDFENSVSIALLKIVNGDSSNRNENKKTTVFVENEGNRIGIVSLPLELSTQMAACEGIVVIEEETSSRVSMILEDYVFDLGRRYAELHGTEEGPTKHREFCLGALSRCKNRLGGERHEQLMSLMARAFDQQEQTGETSLHREWIERLLVDYYDPMYNYQFEKSGGKVLFHGKLDEVVEFCKSYSK
jgi:tRNA 2-selenouridine synthase